MTWIMNNEQSRSSSRKYKLGSTLLKVVDMNVDVNPYLAYIYLLGGT
jgi:hypothetical protein